MLGKKVIVRANGAGVFFGTLKKKNGDEVTLNNARKLWYWEGAAAVEELALNGTQTPNDCKFTVFVDEICIMNVLQILPCTEESIKSIESTKEWSLK